MKFSSRNRQQCPFKEADTPTWVFGMSHRRSHQLEIPTKVAFTDHRSLRHPRIIMKHVGSAVFSPPAPARPGLAVSPSIRPRGFPNSVRPFAQASPRRRARRGKRAPLPAISVPADWAKAAPLPGQVSQGDRPVAPATACARSLPVQAPGDRAERLGRLAVRVLLFWSLASMIWSLAGGWK